MKFITDDSEINESTGLKNTIRNISEIPQVLEEEGVKQPVIHLSNIIKDKKRIVVIMGETHIATKGEERAANRILPYFKYFGCEGVDVKGFIEGKFFFWVMDYIVSPLVSILSFHEKRSKKNKSFIDRACEYHASKTKKVFMLEKGWKPSIRMRIFFVVFPLLLFRSMLMFAINSAKIASDQGSGWALIYIASIVFFVALYDKIPILNNILRFIIGLILDYIFDLGPSRDRNMMKNLIAELNKEEKIGEILVLTGSHHTYSIAEILKNKYGFDEKAFRN